MIPNSVVLEPFVMPSLAPIVPLEVSITPSARAALDVILLGVSIRGSSAIYSDLNGLSAYGISFLCVPISGQQSEPNAINITEQANSHTWITEQLRPILSNVAGYSITPSTAYDASFTGLTTGNFVVPNGTPVTDVSPIFLSFGLSNAAFSGPFGGTVFPPAPANSREIRCYLRTSAEDLQFTVPVTDSTSSNGTWTATAAGLSGIWVLRLFDIATNTQIGDAWIEGQPLQKYLNLEVRVFTISNLQQSKPAIKTLSTNGGTFDLEVNTVGAKRWELFNTATNTVLASNAETTSLVRSYKLGLGDLGYQTPFEQRCYVAYDQALAIIANVLTLGGSKRLVEGALSTQRAGGWFPFSVGQTDPQGDAGTQMYTGAHAWMIYGLAFWYNHEIHASALKTSVFTAILNAVNWLDTMRVGNTGFQMDLYRGGMNLPTQISIPWCALKHNIDVWFALVEAYRATGISSLLVRADKLKTAILTHFWNENTRRFRQVISSPTAYDNRDSLGVNSWGAIWLDAVGELEKRDCAMERVATYFVQQAVGQAGYRPYTPSGGYSGASSTIWGEGSFGVALAWYRFGRFDKYNEVMANLTFMRNNLGGYGYSTIGDGIYEVGIFPLGSVASTAWFILATKGREEIWNPYRNTITTQSTVFNTNNQLILARSASENLSGLFVDSSLQETQVNLGQNRAKSSWENWKSEALYELVDIYSRSKNAATLQITGETLLGQLSRRPAPSKILERGTFTPHAALTLILTRWGIPFVSPIPEMMLKGSATPAAGGTPPSVDGRIRPVLEALTITWEASERPPFIRQILEELFNAFDGYYFRANSNNQLEVIAPSWSLVSAAPVLVLTNQDLQADTWTVETRDELVINRCEVTNQSYEFVTDQTIAPDSLLECGGDYISESGFHPSLPRDVITVPPVYSSTVTYAQGDAVMLKGKRYRCLGTLTPTGDVLIPLGYEPFDFSGTPVEWAAGVTYNKNDVVYTRYFNGFTAIDTFYRANKENTGFDPDLNINRGNSSPAAWKPHLWEVSRMNGFDILQESDFAIDIDDSTAVLGDEIELEVLIEWRRRYKYAFTTGGGPGGTTTTYLWSDTTGTITRYAVVLANAPNPEINFATGLPSGRTDVFTFDRSALASQRKIFVLATVNNTGINAFSPGNNPSSIERMSYTLKIKTRGSKYQRSNITTKATYGETIHDAGSIGLASSRSNYGVRERNISINRFKLDTAACLAIAQNVVESNLEPPLEYKGNLVPPFRAYPNMLGRNVQLPSNKIGILESWTHGETHQPASSSTNMSIKVRVKP
jgi:hypothetical protein